MVPERYPTNATMTTIKTNIAVTIEECGGNTAALHYKAHGVKAAQYICSIQIKTTVIKWYFITQHYFSDIMNKYNVLAICYHADIEITFAKM